MNRFPVTPAATRIFRGYARQDLQEAAFLKELGEVFMPGTPWMLRDLGLAAYIPALVPRGAEQDVPDEVAIIAYASEERYEARDQTLTGRLYGHTHRGVFDMARSHSVRPVPLGTFEGPVTGFALRTTSVDWQVDGDVFVYVGERRDAASGTFGQEAIAALTSLAMPRLIQCLGQVSTTWIACWFLVEADSNDPAAAIRSTLGAAGVPSRELMLERASRLIWRDAPPPAPAARGGAWTYVFERAPAQFLA